MLLFWLEIWLFIVFNNLLINIFFCFDWIKEIILFCKFWLNLVSLFVIKFDIVFSLLLLNGMFEVRCICLIWFDENMIIIIIKLGLVWIKCILLIIFCLWLGWIIKVVYWDIFDNLFVKYVNVDDILYWFLINNWFNCFNLFVFWWDVCLSKWLI